MEKLSADDKWELLRALYKHGCREDKLMEALSNWNDTKITKAIKSYRGRAQRNLRSSSQAETKREPIDLWYEFIEKCHQIEGTIQPTSSKRQKTECYDMSNYSSLIQKSMVYAACFEDHYQGKNPDDPNYNEIYKYLSQLLAGEEPTQLRPGNAKKIIEMMTKLKVLLDDKQSIQNYLDYINDKHTVSYVKPGIDIESILEEKRNKRPELDTSEVNELFEDEDSSSDSQPSDPHEDHYFSKIKKLISKRSTQQRVLASTLYNIPGLNPLEVQSPSLVKPSISLQKTLTNSTRKRKHK